MNRSIIRLKLFALSFFVLMNLSAQEKLTKVSKSIKVDKDVTIDLNTSYCNIEFDTWDKNTVEIEAYIEGDGLSKEELQKALKDWEVEVESSDKAVSIKTKGTPYATWISHGDYDADAVNAMLREMKFELAEMPDFDFDFDFDFDVPEPPEAPEVPEMPEMPEMPALPPLPEGVHSIHFDYEAYKKDGDKYLEKYSKEFEKKYGKDFAKKMEAWGEKFGKQWEEEYAEKMESWAEKFGKEWGEKYGKQMEAWGEQYAKQMERHAERMERQAERTEIQQERLEKMQEERAKVHEKMMKEHEKRHKEREKLAKDRREKVERIIRDRSNSNVKKTIKIRMPKGAKLKVNVRHGELKFAASVDNLKADLSHTTFIAQSINGSTTSVNASYSPVYVTDWNIGELNLNYTEKVQLDNVRQLVLNSNSSNIKIGKLLGNAIIDGSIGDLKIMKIDDSFSNLNMVLQNTDAIIVLPKVPYHIQYKGAQTNFVHPKKSDMSNTAFSTGNLDTNKNIVLKAKFSNVVMQ